jgi:hypothetical protein
MPDTPTLRMLDPARHAPPPAAGHPAAAHPVMDLHEAARQRALALRRKAIADAGDRLVAALAAAGYRARAALRRAVGAVGATAPARSGGGCACPR